MAINPIEIEEPQPPYVDGAHIYITDANYNKIFFVGSIEDTTLINLRGAAISLKSEYIIQVFFGCRVYFNYVQAQSLKKEIDLFRNYENDQEQLDHDSFQALDILETAANMVLKEKDKYMYIIGD